MFIQRSFYLGDDVIGIARELLGKYLCTRMNGQFTSGMIVETEAYNGVIDRASHAYGGRHTARTEIMYRQGGTAYIYLCYGIHSLFNIVTSIRGIPHAVLIRGVVPAEGREIMEERMGRSLDKKAGIGPGKVSKLLGLHFSDTGRDLCQLPAEGEDGIWLEDRGVKANPGKISITPRIGVEYAGKDALLPYRFVYKV